MNQPGIVERLRAERDENEGAMKAWRRRCAEAEAERDAARAECDELHAWLDVVRERATAAEVERDAALAALREARAALRLVSRTPTDALPSVLFSATSVARYALEEVERALLPAEDDPLEVVLPDTTKAAIEAELAADPEVLRRRAETYGRRPAEDGDPR